MAKQKHEHRGNAVPIGPYTIFAGGTDYLEATDLAKADILVTLTQKMPPLQFGRRYDILAAPLVDFGGVPKEWNAFLKSQVIPLLEQNKRLLAFCGASHGRTGVFLASLIALLEPKSETPDPIKALRERHCRFAVETLAQAEAIFAIRGERLPKKYKREFEEPLKEIIKKQKPTNEGADWEIFRQKFK